MTPKEKAEELVKKLFEFNQKVKWDIDNDEWSYDYYLAKQCALIAVDEILDKDGYNNDYWQEVKKNIKNL